MKPTIRFFLFLTLTVLIAYQLVGQACASKSGSFQDERLQVQFNFEKDPETGEYFAGDESFVRLEMAYIGTSKIVVREVTIEFDWEGAKFFSKSIEERETEPNGTVTQDLSFIVTTIVPPAGGIFQYKISVKYDDWVAGFGGLLGRWEPRETTSELRQFQVRSREISTEELLRKVTIAIGGVSSSCLPSPQKSTPSNWTLPS